MNISGSGGRVVDRIRGRSWRLAQDLAFVVAALLAYNGARILNDSPPLTTPYLENFDEGALWLGLALLALVVAAWPAKRPSFPVRELPAKLLPFLEKHQFEIVVFLFILMFGVFMRLFRFQDSLPMPDGLCCEEHINGGVAYRALLGERPLNFLITRWGSAFGFLVFGETTLGLRFFFPVMSIATLIGFYFLLRKLVSVPIALFGFALFAAAWWPALRARQASEGTIYAVLFALALVMALRTKSALWALAVGLLAGLLSYEYEPFKAVPIIATLFLACAAAREIALRSPYTISGARDRARNLARIAFRPLLVAFMACGIVLVPMIIGTHKGYDLYLASVHRQEAGREGDRFADNWQTQLKWAAQVFLPFGPNAYVASPPRDIDDIDLIDPVAAWLALAGLISALFLLLKGIRSFFVMWLLVTLGAAAILLHDFGPWKFLVLVPVVITIAAIFVEDIRERIARRWGSRGVRVLYGGLVVAAAFSMWWNADTLFNEVGPSQAVQEGYGGQPSLLYSVCRDLRDGDDSYAFVSSTTPALTRAFAAPRSSEEAERRAWGDMVWACHGLRGAAVAAPEELWPLHGVPAGPIALVAADPDSIEGLTALLARVYPPLPPPVITTVPGGKYTYVVYRLPNGSALVQSGLWGTYSPEPQTGAGVAGEPAPATRVDDLTGLSWDETPAPIDAPFLVHWQGLVYVNEEMNAALTINSGLPATILLDGRTVFSRSSDEDTTSPVELVPGWHPVEITVTNQSGTGQLSLAWSNGQPLNSADLFPLQQLEGWIQTRTVGLPGGLDEQTTQRLDFAPHYVSPETVALLSQQDGFERQLTDLAWRGVWQIDAAGNYAVRVDFRSGQTTLLVDGQVALESDEFDINPGSIEAQVSLQPGPHSIEIVQSLRNVSPTAGAVISATREGQEIEMRVTPY